MAAFVTLLRRFNERPSFVDERRELEAFREKEAPALEKAWRAWAYGQRALSRKQPQSSLVWLHEAQMAQAEDLPLRAEVLSAEAECWQWLDEPRSAFGPARGAWESWLEMINAPDMGEIGPSAQALLKVLSDPDPSPDLPSNQVFAAWLEDRLTPQFEQAACRLLSLYADFKDAAGAEKISAEFLDWVEKYVEALVGPLSKTLVAKHLIALGDVHDRCGDSEHALATFRESLVKLDGAPEIDEVVWMRAQLMFNSANQLGKLERHEEALETFEAARDELEKIGEKESLMRARYAISFTKYVLGDRDALVDELIDLAGDYEDVLQSAGSGKAQIDAWQMVNKVYRLWAKLSAETLDTGDALQTALFFNQLLALKEWEAKLTGIWHRVFGKQGIDFHSEISVILDRLDERSDTSLLVIEQAPESLILASLSAGPGPWNSRVTVQVIEGDETKAITDLILTQRKAVHELVEGRVERDAPPSEIFLEACNRAWSALDNGIRQSIESAETIFVTIDNQTELDQLPVELFHDGDTYLGLRKNVVRVPSLSELNFLLCENRINAAPENSALVVRAEGDLPIAEIEVQIVETRFDEMGLATQTKQGPDPDDVLSVLCDGVDVFHYVGHGLADEIGEELPLGSRGSLSARALDALSPAPAPMAMLSGCLTGRGRQLRTGQVHGFVPSLLSNGAPGVIAAKYLVGEEFVAEFVDLFYDSWKEKSLAAAVRDVREILAEDDYHPAVWCSYVLFGSPDVYSEAPHSKEATTWPSSALRYLAIGSQAYLARTLQLLEADDRLSAEARRLVKRDLEALADGTPDYFHREIMQEERDLGAFSEAMLASNLIRAFGVLRHPAEGIDDVNGIIGHILTVQKILGDSYALVAVAAELRQRTELYLDQKGQRILRAAGRQLRWLSAEKRELAEAASIITGEGERV